MEPDLLKVKEFASKLRISPSAANRMILGGKVRAINVSNGAKKPRWRIPASEVEGMLKRNETPAPAAKPRCTMKLPSGVRRMV